MELASTIIECIFAVISFFIRFKLAAVLLLILVLAVIHKINS